MALMREKTLNGQWELKDEIITFDLSNARKLSQSKEGWIPQPVPGDIHQGLIAAGKIKEPLVGLNFIDCKWTESRSWWFRRSFDVPADWTRAELVELEMHGLDSNAEVFLNGGHIASHRNAFRPLIVAINGRLKAGTNTLLVRLTTGVEDVRDSDAYSTDGIPPTTEAPHGYPERGERRRSFVRKPQYSFGWDWSPRVATTAIGGNVTIRAINTGCIRRVNLHPARNGDNKVILTAAVLVDWLHHYKSGEGTVTVTLTGPDGKKFKTGKSTFLRSGYNFIEMQIPIKNPLLWWPNGLGEQNLYKVEAKLQIGKDAMDYPAFDYGIRFVELDTNYKFAVVINGKKVFCRGANWIPADAIYARVSDERYEHLLHEARDANFNMLRVWGGGWYERDAFYRACDKYGIMLWHDFMFACAPYPDHLQAFCDEIEKELDYQTRRLSRYACIALWCGCNENNWGWVDWWKEQTKAGARIYNYLLPDIVQRNCPQTPYWNGSPYGGNHPNSEDAGDHHRWHECMMHPEMERRITPEEYDKCRSLFVSEFGYVGACCKETVEEYLGDAALDPTSEVWRQHTNVFEKNTVAAGIRKHYADPERLSIDHYLLYSGLCQGMMYQYALESMRCRANCHGGLFWMFEDCWGEVGWTIIDYYLRRKPSFYFVRRAFAPIRLILRAKGSRISVIAANDTAKAVNLNVECGYISLDGGNSDLKSFKVKLPALERTECCTFAKGRFDPTAGLWIARCTNNHSVQPAIFRAIDYRRLKTTDPGLVYAVTRDRGNCCFAEIRTAGYAHAVHFILPAGAIPEDDFFDLLPGETRTIKITSVRPFDAADIKVTCVNELQNKKDRT